MPRRPTDSFDFSSYPLGGHIPSEKKHLINYPLATFAAPTLPNYKMWVIGVRYDQGVEGACVGMAWSAWASAYDRATKWDAKLSRFDAFEVYHNAQKLDPWAGENYSGTSTGAGGEALRVNGAKLVGSQRRLFIDEYRWVTDVGDICAHIALKGPVVLGMDWYENFDRPVKHAFANSTRQNFFIGEGNLGSIRGGHAIIAQGYYRNRAGEEWIRLQNSWGWDYPFVWIPVPTLRKLWNDGSLEGAVVTKVRA